MAKRLSEFVAEMPKRTRCRVCLLPADLRSQIDTALMASVSPTTISQWLKKECDQEISFSSIRDHKRSGHATVTVRKAK